MQVLWFCAAAREKSFPQSTHENEFDPQRWECSSTLHFRIVSWQRLHTKYTILQRNKRFSAWTQNRHYFAVFQVWTLFMRLVFHRSLLLLAIISAGAGWPLSNKELSREINVLIAIFLLPIASVKSDKNDMRWRRDIAIQTVVL